MTLGFLLSLALLTQTATTPITMVTEVDGVQQFEISWDLEGKLWLQLTGTVAHVNGVTPLQPVAIDFQPLQLNLSPAEELRKPHRVTLGDTGGTAVLDYQYTSIAYSTEFALMGFTFGGAYPAVMAPYTFVAFNYGAYQYLDLLPASGRTADIADVLAGKLGFVAGSGTFELELSIDNSLLNPHPWRPIGVQAVSR